MSNQKNDKNTDIDPLTAFKEITDLSSIVQNIEETLNQFEKKADDFDKNVKELVADMIKKDDETHVIVNEGEDQESELNTSRDSQDQKKG